jgi:3',5'-cyclic AMP phosphodiesterase CpdA
LDSLGTGSGSTPTFRLVWATDIHLNFLKHPHAAQSFGQYLREETQGEAIVLTGDISEAPTVDHHLGQLMGGFGRPTYFVLGNHDYYKGSFESVEKTVSKYSLWLDHGEVHKLTEKVALVGSEGWYDAEFGNPMVVKFGMTDWREIQDLDRLPGIPFGIKRVSRVNGKTVREVLLDKEARQRVIDVCRARSKAFAERARESLLDALTTFEQIVFATHCPPFEGATWHEGELSDSTWVPWFSSKAMGDMLLEIADAHPHRKILVLCGHTHSSGVYSPRPNLLVLTGEAVYYSPNLAGILDITDEGITVSMNLRKTWRVLPIF